jgi:cation transport ATPase
MPELEHTDSPVEVSLIDVDTESVHTVPSDFASQPIKTETQRDRIEHEAEVIEARAKEAYAASKAKAEKAEKEAKAKAKKARSNLEANRDNPVYVGNAVAVVALSAGLGFGAYRKYAAGELTWKVAGAWAGVVGLFATGDYFLSQ